MQERRKQLIQESKFLGGDMQHTHLVKGLDYVLLDKVGGASVGDCQELKHGWFECVSDFAGAGWDAAQTNGGGGT